MLTKQDVGKVVAENNARLQPQLDAMFSKFADAITAQAMLGVIYQRHARIHQALGISQEDWIEQVKKDLAAGIIIV